jgi:prephenate dehydrogenase
MSAKPTLGIIGQGSFGQFAADKLSKHFIIQTSDKSTGDKDFKALAASDLIMLAVPLGAYEDVLNRLKINVNKDSVILDICSVKEKPISLLRKYLPNNPILATHPLFGPESASESLEGHDWVICPTPQSPKELLDKAVTFGQSLGLNVHSMDASAHDEMIADLQGITFYVARALVEYGIAEKHISTPSYRRLLYLADLERHHSKDLFDTIETGNQYARANRRKLLKILKDIADQLDDQH